MLADHLDGLSFRKLAQKYNVSVGTAFRKVQEQLENLPHCADVTRKYCSRFSGILLVDGKFLKVQPYEHKIPVIYGIDYLTHDIPTYRLAPSENYIALTKYFQSLRLLNYPLQSIVSDDNSNIAKACKFIYPKAISQLCTVHLKENIRKSLNTRQNPFYRPFIYDIEKLFRFRRSTEDFNNTARKILLKYKYDHSCVAIMLDINKCKDSLITYTKVPKTPTTNNLIECFNSHLNGRLKTIKSFQNLRHANLWLNAYFIRRRLRVFTDCTGKFKKLNGKCSLELSLKDTANLKKLQSMFR